MEQMQDIGASLDGFDSLWSRVVSQAEQEPKLLPAQTVSDRTPQTALAVLIEESAEMLTYYNSLTGKIAQAQRRVLLDVAAKKKKQLHELQLEHFLLSGDSHVPPKSCAMTQGVLASLRQAWLRERELAEKLRFESVRAPSEIGTLYLRMAQENLQLAEDLKQLLSGIME